MTIKIGIVMNIKFSNRITFLKKEVGAISVDLAAVCIFQIYDKMSQN